MVSRRRASRRASTRRPARCCWSERLDGEFSASPVLAGGQRVLLQPERQDVRGEGRREYNVVAENRLDGRVHGVARRSSGDDLFLRTKTHLYAIGKK